MKILESNAGRMEAQLRQWGAALDKLIAKAEAAGTKVKADYRQGVDDLQAKCKIAQSKLDESKAAGSAKWGILKDGLEAAWTDIETAFKKLGKSSAAAVEAQPTKTEHQAGTG
jgi:hypothetical protein